MIISIDERSFSSGVNADLEGAMRGAILAFRMGTHALAVSPSALALADNSAISEELKDGLRLAHADWLDAQALIQRASRVVHLTGNQSEDGRLEGNTYSVYNGVVANYGLFRESSFVAEAVRPDGDFIRLLLKLALGIDGDELNRCWQARTEPGGGGGTHAYAHRYAAEPTPMILLMDHDGPSTQPCGATAEKCLQVIEEKGVFSSRAAAIAGGYSDVRPNFGVRIFSCHEIENLITPRLAHLIFTSVIQGRYASDRLNYLMREFPSFPNLSDPEARRWLDYDFKKVPALGRVLSSEVINALTDYFDAGGDNAQRVREAFQEDMRHPVFSSVVRDIVRDVWTVGIRFGALR